MTVHAAKGLEWDVVAVPGLAKGVFPVRAAPPRGLGGPRRYRASCAETVTICRSGPIPSPGGCTRYLDAAKENEGYEERRLAYVAVTRAREVLLCSGFWWSSTAKKPLIPRSTFFGEIEAAAAAGAGVVEEAAPARTRAMPIRCWRRSGTQTWPGRRLLWFLSPPAGPRTR